ncbi:hypothetical protein BDZ91DRAFT_730562 [Kalaharituber pfeilii]|nr:hypothetical protein BDZ91DRAFT_730562 [Kalaharituber pfeilii]
MQDARKRLHVLRVGHGNDFYGILFIGAGLTEAGSSVSGCGRCNDFANVECNFRQGYRS